MSVARILMVLAAAGALIALSACDRTINNVMSDSEPLSCAGCHDPGDVITGKETQWAVSAHGMGDSYVRGTRSSCAGCHSGSAFSERILEGLNPSELDEGDPDPTRQDCRTCHQIHETFTEADWALEIETPVALYAEGGTVFDGGHGNLCVQCHQPRRTYPGPDSTGVVRGISTHWGPHHGPQSAMLLGIGGAGVTGSVSPHYGAVPNTCVGCHMGENRNHEMEPDEDTCQQCHPTADSFDYEGIQTEIAGMSDQLGALLLAAGLIDENSEDGHPIVTEAPEDQAIALYNWLYVAHEDQSLGVHNPDYARALLEEGLARMGAGPVAQ